MVAKGWCHLPTAEKNAKRYALHIEAKCPESSTEFTNQHFSRYKARCEALIAGKNDGGTQAVDADDARRRLIWRIKEDAKKAGLAPEYISEVAKDLAVLGNWEDLDLAGLENLMHTIHNRAGKKLGKDTRNVHTPAPRKTRVYTMDAVPRMFTPARKAAAPVPHATDDNEPF